MNNTNKELIYHKNYAKKPYCFKDKIIVLFTLSLFFDHSSYVFENWDVICACI